MADVKDTYEAGQDFLDLPWDASTAGQSYQDRVRARLGDLTFYLEPVEYEADGHTIRAWVTDDALMLDGVRVNATAAFQQEVADALGMYLLTTRLVDEAWESAQLQIAPSPKSATEKERREMGTVAAMVAHNGRVNAKLGGYVSGIVADPGKTWVLASGKVATYGWHKPGGGMIQGAHFGHGLHHSDYSQTIRLAGRVVEIDGVETDLAEAYLQYPSLFGSPGGASVPLSRA